MSETPSEQPLPEFKRESGGGLPWVGIIVVIILALAGLALVGFALFAGQGESENRAVNSTVAAVLAFTATPSNTLPPTVTPAPTNTPEPVIPTDTAVPPTAVPLATDTVAPPALAPTNTRPAQPVAVPTGTPLPTVATTVTPAPPVSGRGIAGELTLCNPEKPTFAATIERICFREKIVNTTSQAVAYDIIGVQATNLSGGPSQFQTSWRGDLSIGPGCTGPTDSCGGPWEDGMYFATPGTYRLTLSICYSKIDVCLGSSGDWETLTSGVEVTVISWTPSP
jgi:hypothetical protein